jgi:methylmalonyl-CoA/ethylmalonyl-CoA epimerase
MTFKVPDIRATMAVLDGAGFPLVDVDLSYPDWQEAFVHPKAAFGFLVQIAQAAGDMPGAGAPPGFPDAAGTASLDRLVLAVASLDAALGLYQGALGTAPVADGDDEGRWVHLDTGSPMTLRLWQPADPGVLAGTTGRADHLVLAVGDPADVPGAVETSGGWEIPAAANHGARIVLRPAD